MPDQGITRTQRGEEQPKDKERAQTVHKTRDENPGAEKQRIEEKQRGDHLPSHADQDAVARKKNDERVREEVVMSKFSTDNVDVRSGAYDPVTKDGLPEPHQVRDKETPYQKDQQGADVRPEPLPGTEPVLPEGLVREPKGPLNARTGRREAD